MNVQINVPVGIDNDNVITFLSQMKFDNLLIRPFGESPSSLHNDSSDKASFCIDVISSHDDLASKALDSLLGSNSCSLLFYDDSLAPTSQPKVVFATDHSNQAKANLDFFRQLKPIGFGGAMVISDGDSDSLGTSSHEMSRTFLERIKSAVHSTQANLIIANFDLKSKSMQMSNLVKMVLQNKCHVLILKSY